MKFSIYARHVLPVLLVLLGCATALPSADAKPPSVDQKYSAEYIRSHVVIGKTTSEEVEAMFGKPHDVSGSMSTGGGSTTWRYSRSEEKSAGKLLSSIRSKVGSAADLIGENAYEIVGATYEAQRKLNDVNNLTGAGSGSAKYATIYFSFKNNVVDSVTF